MATPVDTREPRTTQAQPTSTTQRTLDAAQTTALAYGAAYGATAVAPPIIASIAAQAQARVVAEATTAILEALGHFARQRQATIVPFLASQLEEQYTHRTPQEIALLLAEEQKRERRFLQRQRQRVARDLPRALRETDAAKRRLAVGKLLTREQRYQRLREQAMAARAHTAADMLDLAETSPQGALWMLSDAVVNHTPGCVAMSNQFWPWAVLKRYHPPVHPGCPCWLQGLDEALAAGLMKPGQLPDPHDAMLRAARNMALEEALDDLLLDEGDVRALTLDLLEGKKRKRYPKGTAKGGEFMPALGGDAGGKAKYLLGKLLPHGAPQLPGLGQEQGRHVWLRGHYTFIPHDRHFGRVIDNVTFSSPPGTTNVYREGELVGAEGEQPTHPDLQTPTGAPGALLPKGELPAPAADASAALRSQLETQIAKRLEQPKQRAPVDVGQPGKAAHDALLASGFVVRPSRSVATKQQMRVAYINQAGHELTLQFSRKSGNIEQVEWSPDLTSGGLLPWEWKAFKAGKEPPGWHPAKGGVKITGPGGPAKAGKPAGGPWEPSQGTFGGFHGGGYSYTPPPPPKPVVYPALGPPPATQGLIPNYDHVELTTGASAGGSTGARIATSSDGTKYLLKTYGGDQDRVATELLGNAIYRAMGAKVADAGVRNVGSEPDFATIPDVPLDEPPIEATAGQRVSSGIILRDPAGNVTIYEPRNHFGGYQHTFPKGGVEKGLSPQQNAHKELWEETGLHAKITGLVGDYQGDTGVSRYYTGVRTGGSETTGPETQAVKTVTPEQAAEMLNRSRDKTVLADALTHPLPTGEPGPDTFPPNAYKAALTYPLLKGEPRKITEPSTEIGRHFMTDALLGNWDFIGLADDNILWSPEGQPFRVDQGGTLQYRAMGGAKPFGPVPSEVWSMRSPKGQGFGKINVSEADLRSQAAEIEQRLPPAAIDALVDAAPFKDGQMREQVRDALKQRVAWMGRYSRGEEHEPRPLEGEEAAFELSDTQKALQLFPEQHAALQMYADAGEGVNAHLRSGAPKEKASDDQRFIVRELDSLLGHVQTQEDVTAYVGFDLGAVLGKGKPDQLPGRTLYNKGFLNLSLSEGEARKADGVMRVLMPAGSHALYTRGIEGADDMPAHQPDLIAQRGGRLRIVGQTHEGGKTYFDAVLLP